MDKYNKNSIGNCCLKGHLGRILELKTGKSFSTEKTRSGVIMKVENAKRMRQ